MIQTILSGSVKVYSIDREKLIENIKMLSHEIKTKFNYVRNIVVFGSIAKNNQRGTSDVDLIIVVDKLNKENFWEIYGELYNFIATKIDAALDLIVMDEENFEKDKNKFGETIVIF